MSLCALIDADSIIFNCGFAVERTVYELWVAGEEQFGPLHFWNTKKEMPPEWANSPIVEAAGTGPSPGNEYITRRRSLEPLENCLHLVKTRIMDILRETAATDYKIYIKGKGNFREALAVTRKYKGNRDGTARPTYEEEIRKYLKQVWHAEEVDGREADDEVCIQQMCTYSPDLFNNFPEQNRKYAVTIIVSADKDLDQVPGWHYSHARKEKYWVSELEGWRFFYQQVLSGDSSDNIVGVEGVGKIGAKKLLAECKTVEEMFHVVYDKYQEVYKEQASEKLTEMANLVYLIRELDKDGNPVMWSKP